MESLIIIGPLLRHGGVTVNVMNCCSLSRPFVGFFVFFLPSCCVLLYFNRNVKSMASSVLIDVYSNGLLPVFVQTDDKIFHEITSWWPM